METTNPEKPEGARERDVYQKKGTIGQWTSIKDTFPPCQKCPSVTTEQLKQHNTMEDLWTVVRGTVYDITQVLQEIFYILYFILFYININSSVCSLSPWRSGGIASGSWKRLH